MLMVDLREENIDSDLKENKHPDLGEKNFDSDLEEEKHWFRSRRGKHSSRFRGEKLWFRFRGGMKWCDSDKCNKVWIDSS